MRQYDFLEKMSDDEALKFKRCIRKLLDSTFIVADKDPVLFDYMTYSSNRYDISSYLKVIGYDIVVDDDFKYAMLIQNGEDEDVVGLKKINHLNFSNSEVLLLLVLWLLFLEHFGKEEQTFIVFEEIIDMEKQYDITMSPNELRNSLKLFKRYNLIDYNQNNLDFDTIIKLYPTLQFALDKEQFNTLVKTMTNDLNDNEYEEIENLVEDNDE